MTRTRVLKAAAGLAAATAALVVALPGLAADGISPASVSLTLNPGASQVIEKTVHLDAAPAKADIVLAVDTTGSMSAAISQAKTDATNIVNGVQALIPGARFAVVNFDDYPFDPYGTAGFGCNDVPYQLLQGLTANATDVQTAINTLSLHCGNDGPEAYNRVFYESYSDPALTYDSGAVKLLVVLGDSVPHDPAQSTTFPSCYDTYADPGPDGIVGTADDLFTKPTLDGMVTNNVKLLFVNYGSDACHHELATYTGGSDVSSGSGGSLASQIVTLVQTAAAHIGSVTLQVSPAGFASWVTESPAPPYGPLTAPVDFGWNETITAPAATPAGLYSFDVAVVADGATRATQHVTVRVNSPPACSGASAGPDLWPPNHKLSDARSITGVTDPDGDPVSIHVDSIFQDEPTNGLGDGDTGPADANILGANSFNVRAERSGTANGRVYYVNFTATDAFGGTCSGTATIGVPHDQASAPVGDGQLFNSIP